jgi:Protein of unknown function (DUF3108)
MRMTRGFSAAVLAALLSAGLAAPALAETDQGSFELVLKGIKAGRLDFSAVQEGNAYAVTGRLKSGGLVSLLRKVSYEASANGAVSGGRYTPASYSENADTGKRQSQSVMAYVQGVPQVKSYNPPRPPRDYDVDPAQMGGTVDPLTALYATLRDVPAGQECQVSLSLFDGRRQSAVKTFGRQEAGDQVVCQGEYRRVAGYSAEDLAEKTRFAFTMIYAPAGEGRMQVTEVGMDTLFGKAKLVRQ